MYSDVFLEKTNFQQDDQEVLYYVDKLNNEKKKE